PRVPMLSRCASQPTVTVVWARNRTANLSLNRWPLRHLASWSSLMRSLCNASLMSQPLESYRWSSYPLYLRESTPRPAWLRVDGLLGEWGIRWDEPGAGGDSSPAHTGFKSPRFITW